MLHREFRRPLGYFVDSNLLVLLVVGSVGPDLITKHRRLQDYSREDFESLVDLLSHVDRLCVTPNTLTETSNLLAQHGEPERSLLMENLRSIIQESWETVVTSVEATGNHRFVSLGLADAALLEAISPEAPLVTADADLFVAAVANGNYNAVNFTSLRQP